MTHTQGAIFLDRDGVINENSAEHIKSWDEFTFIPGALDSLRDLAQTGLPIFIVTNQAAVNRGMMSHETLDDIHRRMIAIIEEAGGRITKVYYCPHDNHEGCECRKPGSGMLKQAAAEFGINLKESFMVGDAWTDVGAGFGVGARSILLLTGRGRWNFAPAWNRFGLNFAAACDIADATTMIRAALAGHPMESTARLRNAFHMALHPREALVL